MKDLFIQFEMNLSKYTAEDKLREAYLKYKEAFFEKKESKEAALLKTLDVLKKYESRERDKKKLFDCSALKMMILAELEFSKRDVEEIKKFEEEIKKEGTLANNRTWHGLGLFHYSNYEQSDSKEELKRAEECFSRVLELSELSDERGIAYYYLMEIAKIEKNKAKMKKILNEGAENNKKNLDLVLEKIKIEKEEGEYEKAVETAYNFLNALESCIDEDVTFLINARTSVKKEKEYNKLVRKYSLLLGEEKAEAMFLQDDVIKIENKSGLIKKAKGIKGEHPYLCLCDGSESELRNAIRLDANYFHAYKRLAEFYYKKADEEEAKEFCKKALSIEPHDLELEEMEKELGISRLQIVKDLKLWIDVKIKQKPSDEIIEAKDKNEESFLKKRLVAHDAFLNAYEGYKKGNEETRDKIEDLEKAKKHKGKYELWLAFLRKNEFKTKDKNFPNEFLSNPNLKEELVNKKIQKERELMALFEEIIAH